MNDYIKTKESKSVLNKINPFRIIIFTFALYACLYIYATYNVKANRKANKSLISIINQNISKNISNYALSIKANDENNLMKSIIKTLGYNSLNEILKVNVNINANNNVDDNNDNKKIFFDYKKNTVRNILNSEIKVVSKSSKVSSSKNSSSNTIKDDNLINCNKLDYANEIMNEKSNNNLTNVNKNKYEIDYESFHELKSNMISVFNSNDSNLILEKIKQMFIFENPIKEASSTLDYSQILKSTDNKFDFQNKKVLIFHTHSQETYKDSTDTNVDGVIAMGDELSKILTEQYGMKVIHYKGKHDIVNNSLNRNGSYERIESAINQILEEDKDIDLLIDLHRDGVPESKRLVTTIDGKECAKLMFVNGICMLNKNGKLEKIDYLQNDYIDDNFNLSMNAQIATDKLYPTLSRKILVKPYRYSLHMKPNSLLIELGAQNNTVQEIRNTLPLLAKIIYTAICNKNEKM